MHFYLSYHLKKQNLTLALALCAFSLSAVEKLDTTKVYNIGEVTVVEQYRNTEVRASAPLQILSSKQIEKLNENLSKYFNSQAKYFSVTSTVRDAHVGYWFKFKEHPEIDQHEPYRVCRRQFI